MTDLRIDGVTSDREFWVSAGMDARPSPNGATLWVRLGRNARPCGGCSCAWCIAHPNEEPAWDTLAISPHGKAWTIHAPEFWGGGPLRRADR